MSIILDIDGTVLRSGIYPIQKTIDYVNGLGETVDIVTGRTKANRAATEQYLKKAGVKYSRLYMNPYSTKESLKFKKEMANSLKGQATLAIDNDAEARQAYAAKGIKTLDPASIK
mgnify:CR=1 FL=1